MAPKSIPSHLAQSGKSLFHLGVAQARSGRETEALGVKGMRIHSREWGGCVSRELSQNPVTIKDRIRRQT